MPSLATYGIMEAKPGDSCSNSGTHRFTTPCCYTDLQGAADRCPTCGAPIVCTMEQEPVSICRIADTDEEIE